jgi:hypothetical protein
VDGHAGAGDAAELGRAPGVVRVVVGEGDDREVGRGATEGGDERGDANAVPREAGVDEDEPLL